MLKRKSLRNNETKDTQIRSKEAAVKKNMIMKTTNNYNKTIKSLKPTIYKNNKDFS